MLFKILLALYVVVALAMIALILLQTGQGAAAGSGFGGGASATVFGSRGSANFLSSSTKWLAVAFFGLSIGVGIVSSRDNKPGEAVDLGVMADAGALDTEVPATTPAPTGDAEVPAVPADASTSEVPAADSAPAAPIDAAAAPAVEAAPQVEQANENASQGSSNGS